MKKNLLIMVLLLIFISRMAGVETNQNTRDNSRDEELIVAETDLICTFFITKRISEDIRITGAQEMDLERVSYSDHDELFIDKGAKDGFKEGDLFHIIGKGGKIRNPFTSKKLGTYYQRKSLAEITCIFEDKAVITLRDACGPVELSDIPIPYKKEEIIKKKRLSYKTCVLPFSPVEGNVVYINLFMEVNREHAASENYVAIDIGKAFVSRGDYVLFYKRFTRKLPPLIIGLGVIIDPQNTNSTVRVLEASNPIEIGNRAILIPETTLEKKIEKGEEVVPIIEAGEDVVTASTEEQSIELNMLFKFDEKTLDPQQRSDLDKIKEFVAARP
ncbi:MAG: hypothetical protein L0Y73_00435, partial [Candidatus Aminicenantes bacterium]|nr:hypothetical protein [Candidatus Aminicenantes bacterium]